MNKIKKLIFIFLSIILLVVSIPQKESYALDWDPVKWVSCSLGESGQDVLKATRTEYIPFMLSSKSAIAEIDNPKYNFLNGLLSVSGYKFDSNDETIDRNPFDEFGFLGLKFTSYRGEWKYFNVNPCASGDRQEAISSNFGQFYETRKEPLSSHSEMYASVDNRTKEFAKGTNAAFYKALTDRFSNTLLFIAKTVVALTLALISLSLTDISTIIGLNVDVQKEILLKLYNGFFVPFVILMFVLTAIYIFYYGIIKREYRQALMSGLLRPIICFVLAVIIATFPIVTTYPNKLANFGQALIISSTGSFFKSDGSNDLCKSEKGLFQLDSEDPNILDKTSENMRSIIGCRMWSEFLFKPYVVGQWGTNYENLDSLDNVNKEWVKSPKVKLGGREIENWALFQISVMSGKHKSIDEIDSPLIGDVHKDYYRIVDALSNYDEKDIEVELAEINNFSSGNINMYKNSGGLLKHKNVQDFLKKYQSDAEKIAKEYNIPVSVLLAQMALESSYGKSKLSNSKYNNFFGIKCNSRVKECKEFPTTEEINGKKVKVNAKFALFKSPEESMRDYAKLITSNTYATAKGAQNWAEFLSAISPVYSTDSSYATQVANIIRGMGLEDLDTHFNKTPVDFEKINKLAAEGGGLNGINTYPEPQNNKPLEYWNYWTGYYSGHRIGYAFIIFLFSILGSMLPLIFAMTSSVLGIGITMLSFLSPIFLLLGCWGGKGDQIFMNWLGTLLSTIIKKIIVTFLMMFSIIVTSSIMEIMNTVGFVKCIIFLIIIITAILKNKERLISELSRVNIGQLNTQHTKNAIGKLKRVTLGTGEIAAGGVSGGITAKKYGGSFLSGAGHGASQILRNKAYTSNIGRKANTVYETTVKGKKGEFESQDRYCCVCGVKIAEDTTAFIDEYNNYYCEDCAAANSYEGLTEVFIDNKKDNNMEVTENEEIEIEGKNLQHLSYKELVEKYDYTNLEMNWSEQKKQIEERINQSLEIIKLDMKRIKENNGSIKKPFVPEPIRNFVNPIELQKTVKNDNFDGYYNIIEDGWKNWHINNSLKSDIDIKEAKKMADDFILRKDERVETEE